MAPFRKVIVIGLDGLESSIVEPMLAQGRLPHLARLRRQGGFGRIATTMPAQTPVAWSTFATGLDPGGHGIFDFVRRDPATYAMDLGLNRYEQRSMFVPPRAVNLRRGIPMWQVLADQGIPSSVIRCPVTFPPDEFRGRMLSGMGVPDVRGGLGTGTFYTTQSGVRAGEAEHVVPLSAAADGMHQAAVVGPRHPKTREPMQFAIRLQVQAAEGSAVVHSDGEPRAIELRVGAWSPWLKVRFKAGFLQTVRGMVRFYLSALTPEVQLYASPVNFDSHAPMFRISTPPEYAAELEQGIGTFYTTGMVEDHGALQNGRISEEAFLQQCGDVMRERQQMMEYELARLPEGLFYCLFDTPDRIQHMFWRFRDPEHPARLPHGDGRFAHAIEDHYAECDKVVGQAMRYADDQTLFIVLSDHGFGSFRRGVHLNTWLYEQGLLALKEGGRPGPDSAELFAGVDWSRTRAYALGLTGIYLNLRGREGQGILSADEAAQVQDAVVKNLTSLRDPANGRVAVRSVSRRQDVYHGACVADAPDVVVGFAAGYRVSWATGLGGIPAGLVEDNTRRWSGDHIVDPALVPGVLFMNRAFDATQPRLLDMAPTILAALGAETPATMAGRSLLGDAAA